MLTQDLLECEDTGLARELPVDGAASRFEAVERAIAAMSRGEMVVVIDDEDRENEGDLILAAEFATAEKLAFLVRYTSGVICVALTGERCDQLNLPLMVSHTTDRRGTAFTLTTDVKEGTTTGISASDRAKTCRALVDPRTEPNDLARPGHVFPLRARSGGVLERVGHTEAAVDLTRLAGLRPGGVLCEIVNDDGSMARRRDLDSFCVANELTMVSVADLVRYRRDREVTAYERPAQGCRPNTETLKPEFSSPHKTARRTQRL